MEGPVEVRPTVVLVPVQMLVVTALEEQVDMLLNGMVYVQH
jgi:hypothetical protein